MKPAQYPDLKVLIQKLDKRNKERQAARKAAQTRKAAADKRSMAAKRGAETRRQRDARGEAMVEATKRD